MEYPTPAPDWRSDRSVEAAPRSVSPVATSATGWRPELAPIRQRSNSSDRIRRIREGLCTTTTGTISVQPSDLPGRCPGLEEKRRQSGADTKSPTKAEADL